MNKKIVIGALGGIVLIGVIIMLVMVLRGRAQDDAVNLPVTSGADSVTNVNGGSGVVPKPPVESTPWPSPPESVVEKPKISEVPSGMDRPLTTEEKKALGYSADVDVWVKSTSLQDGSAPMASLYFPPGSDSDRDGLSDVEEKRLGTDPKDVDTDHDTLWDSSEVAAGLDPKKKDTDGDGIDDATELNALDTHDKLN